MKSHLRKTAKTYGVQARLPPDAIRTPKEALEAFNYITRLQGLADRMKARASDDMTVERMAQLCWPSDVNSEVAQKRRKAAGALHAKGAVYARYAEAWASVLREWLRKEAQK